MHFHILTLFPEMVLNGLGTSIIGRAQRDGLLTVDARNIRDYTTEKHGHVDDYPYGGGAGMLMQADPIMDAEGDLHHSPGTSFRPERGEGTGKRRGACDPLRTLRGRR